LPGLKFLQPSAIPPQPLGLDFRLSIRKHVLTVFDHIEVEGIGALAGLMVRLRRISRVSEKKIDFF
jgi:hypothetical protein